MPGRSRLRGQPGAGAECPCRTCSSTTIPKPAGRTLPLRREPHCGRSARVLSANQSFCHTRRAAAPTASHGPEAGAGLTRKGTRRETADGRWPALAGPAVSGPSGGSVRGPRPGVAVCLAGTRRLADPSIVPARHAGDPGTPSMRTQDNYATALWPLASTLNY